MVSSGHLSDAAHPQPDADALRDELIAALGEKDAGALIATLRSASVLVTSELTTLLDDQGKCDLATARAYCDRWETEGPPRPSLPPRRPRRQRDYDPYERMREALDRGYDPYDHGTWAAADPRPPRPPLELWDDDETQRWRGRLRASLKALSTERTRLVDRRQPPLLLQERGQARHYDQPQDPSTDFVQLIGWNEILDALGFGAKNRRQRERVKLLNASTGGPIMKRGKRGVIANRGTLMTWWRGLAERAEAAAKARSTTDRDDAATQNVLKNAGERRDLGLHDKERPNTRRRPG